MSIIRKEECDELILDMCSNNGDIFISDELMSLNETTAELCDIDLYFKLSNEAYDKYTFAIIFKTVFRFCITYTNAINDVRDDILDNFIQKYEYIISWLWCFIVYYNLWPPIKFIGSIIVTVCSK